MDTQGYFSRRHLSKLKFVGWSAMGFMLIFCVLTVQLSATEGRSSQQSSSTFASESSGNVVEVLPMPLADDVMLTESVAAPPALMVVGSEALPETSFQQRTHAQPSGSYSATGSDFLQSTQMIMADQSAEMDMQFMMQGQGCSGDYQPQQAMPRSNYFGLDPNQVRDEWEGFCDCEQKPFSREARRPLGRRSRGCK